MQRVDWIWLTIGVVAAVGVAILGYVRGVTMNVPFWALVVLVAFMPLARSYGHRRAREMGRELRERHHGST